MLHSPRLHRRAAGSVQAQRQRRLPGRGGANAAGRHVRHPHVVAAICRLIQLHAIPDWLLLLLLLLLLLGRRRRLIQLHSRWPSTTCCCCCGRCCCGCCGCCAAARCMHLLRLWFWRWLLLHVGHGGCCRLCRRQPHPRSRAAQAEHGAVAVQRRRFILAAGRLQHLAAARGGVLCAAPQQQHKVRHALAAQLCDGLIIRLNRWGPDMSAPW